MIALSLFFYLNAGLVRSPYEPVLSSPAESRTFFLIQQIVQNVATSIQRCQVGVFSLLISRCQQPTTTTTTTEVTTTGTGTAATTPATTETATTITTTAPQAGK